ncbi:MAG: 4Fe-4S binding protein [Dehalococcoidales bacterium]|nr:4Fe-4S binding protein [Dehalococcoidales bacterium]
MGIKVDLLRCVGCGACVLVCPVGVLIIEDMKCRVLEGCISCGLCVSRCNWRALSLTDETAPRKEDRN